MPIPLVQTKDATQKFDLNQIKLRENKKKHCAEKTIIKLSQRALMTLVHALFFRNFLCYINLLILNRMMENSTAVNVVKSDIGQSKKYCWWTLPRHKILSISLVLNPSPTSGLFTALDLSLPKKCAEVDQYIESSE